MPEPLEYFNPNTVLPEPSGGLVSVAMACGAGPMAAGVLTTLLWVGLRIQALMLVGVWVIAIGIVLLAVGLLCLAAFVLMNWGYLARGNNRLALWRSISMALLLLLTNIPLCFLCVFVALATGAPV